MDLNKIFDEAIDKTLSSKDAIDILLDFSDFQNRSIYLEGISDDAANEFLRFINFFNFLDSKLEEGTPREPIKVYINSGGGDLTATLMIADLIKFSETPVWTIVVGKAYSGGLFISVCGKKRFALSNASFLFHEGSISSVGADANKFQNMSDFYKQERLQLKEIILDNTNIDEELYNSHINDDWWILTKEALKLGIIDEIK